MEIMTIIGNILGLFGGLGIFLFGLKYLGDSLEMIASGKLRGLFEKLSDKKLKGLAVGAGATAIIQSSSATTVIIIGFLNASLLSLSQAVPIIMGANIGTTVTALIMSLPVTEIFMALGCVGMFIIMFVKSDFVKRVATIFVGLAMIFAGLSMMSSFMIPFRPVLQVFFAKTSNPVLLLLIGLVFTAIVQSSSAVTGILIAMVGGAAGDSIIGIYSCIFILLGVNMGTCVTAMLASVGSNANGKRAALIHFTFNFLGALLFFAVMIIKPAANGLVFVLEKIPDVKMQIAVFHIAFNVITAALLLPLSELMVKFAEKIIKVKPSTEPETEMQKLKYVNELMLSSPSLALAQVRKEILDMAAAAEENLEYAYGAVVNVDLEGLESFKKREDYIDFLNREITKYLVKISSLELTYEDENIIGEFYHAVSDIERIGDYAENITEYAEKLAGLNASFSEDARLELKEMYDKICELYGLVMSCFVKKDEKAAKRAATVEDEIDDFNEKLSEAHIRRLNEGKCTPDSGALYLSLVSNLERIADHMTNLIKI